MQKVTDTRWIMPFALYMNAHQKMLIAMELGFATCLPEAHSILRDAIESLVHAHRLLSDSDLQVKWLQKNDGEIGEHEFKEEFWYSKRDKLFDGLPELLKLWGHFSEFGSHTNINSIVTRFFRRDGPSDVDIGMNYLGVPAEVLIPALFEVLLVFHVMEEVFYKDFEDRLKLDPELGRMRTQFHIDREKLRKRIIVEFNIPRPTNDSAP